MAGDDELDPDRAAILARRRRFIALAISGLATTGCKTNNPEPCLSVAAPNDGEPDSPPDPEEPGPFVEDPGAPLDGSGGEEPLGPEETEPPKEPPPEVCLKIAAPPSSNPSPKPCLKKAPPHPCLLMID